MKTFDLTTKELAAARVLVATCLDNMGGKRPSDLDNDPFTWVDLKDLTAAGYSRHEAAGLLSSLAEKRFIDETDRKTQWAVTDAGYRWLDTVWDALQAQAEGSDLPMLSALLPMRKA